MKKYFLITGLIVISSLCVDGSEKSAFIQQINTLWKAKNYDQILQLATTEAAKQSPPPEVYAVLFGYHLFIAANHEQAVQSLNSLLAKLENTNSASFEAVMAFKSDFLQAPSDQIHQMFPDDFPIRSLLLLISQPD